MKRHQLIKLVLLGGQVEFTTSDDDHQEMQIEPVYFKPYVLLLAIICILIFFLSPLVVMPSKIGFIPYDYPDYLIHSTKIVMYLYLLFLTPIMVIQFNTSILPGIPVPTTINAKIIVFIILLAAYTIGVIALNSGIRRLKENLKQKRSERLNRDNEKEITYDCLLSFVRRKE